MPSTVNQRIALLVVDGFADFGASWQGARESLEIARRLRVAYCRLNRLVPIGRDQGSMVKLRSISSRWSVDLFPSGRSP